MSTLFKTDRILVQKIFKLLLKTLLEEDLLILLELADRLRFFLNFNGLTYSLT